MRDTVHIYVVQSFFVVVKFHELRATVSQIRLSLWLCIYNIYVGWLREAVDDPDEVFKKVVLFPLLESEVQHKVDLFRINAPDIYISIFGSGS